MKPCSFCEHKERGFTLVELLITVAIATLLMMVAIPGLDSFRRNAELTSASNSLLAGLNAARSEAMKKGTNAMVVPANNVSWNSGWTVFVLGAGNTTQAFDATTDTVVLQQAALPSYFNVAGNSSAFGSSPYIMFDASGYSKLKSGAFGALTLNFTRTDLSGSALSEQTRRVKISSVGRANVCRPKTATDVNCPASD